MKLDKEMSYCLEFGGWVPKSQKLTKSNIEDLLKTCEINFIMKLHNYIIYYNVQYLKYTCVYAIMMFIVTI